MPWLIRPFPVRTAVRTAVSRLRSMSSGPTPSSVSGPPSRVAATPGALPVALQLAVEELLQLQQGMSPPVARLQQPQPALPVQQRQRYPQQLLPAVPLPPPQQRRQLQAAPLSGGKQPLRCRVPGCSQLPRSHYHQVR